SVHRVILHYPVWSQPERPDVELKAEFIPQDLEGGGQFFRWPGAGSSDGGTHGSFLHEGVGQTLKMLARDCGPYYDYRRDNANSPRNGPPSVRRSTDFRFTGCH